MDRVQGVSNMEYPTDAQQHIRPADIGDVQAVSQLYVSLGRHQPIDSDEFSRFLEEPGQCVAVYVDRGGSPIGLVAWTTWAASLSFPQSVCFIQDVVVLPEFRRRGVATELLGHVRKWGQTHGIRVFHVQASLDNQADQELYRHNGYQHKNCGFYDY